MSKPALNRDTLFNHYMYVLECADGSLYTGYSTDVAARVAVHNAGKGAKYTKARLPVRLRVQVRFYTKQRAMSAEYHFKQLDRASKEAFISAAESVGEDENGEDIFRALLQDSVPSFPEEPIEEYIAHQLAENIDDKYQLFQAKLIPNLDSESILGVRTPVLKSIAKKLARRDDLPHFLNTLPHVLFEEKQLHAFVLGNLKDYDEALARIEAYLPYVDNWATCDQLSTKLLAKQPGRTLEEAREWIACEHTYTARFGMGVLMRHFLDERFDPCYLDLVANRYAEDDYYLNMMRAWFFAECMAKQPDAALPYLQPGVLDEWTRHKAIQKACESFRVPDDLKAQLKALR